MEPVVHKICSHCNKEFELKKISHNRNYRASMANFEDCPHCGKRNDQWIKIDWPKEKD